MILLLGVPLTILSISIDIFLLYPFVIKIFRYINYGIYPAYYDVSRSFLV
nr:MAG TPA: hypothetical protein [Caudoviricetes sp.]